MRIVLCGADFEENLGVGMIAAVAAQAGHEVWIEPYNGPREVDAVTERVLARRPDVVGLSIQFQHRSADFLNLARSLRRRGFDGHLTAGGQFPTLAWRDAIADSHGLDSLVLHEGEDTFVELLDALGSGRRAADVPGLAVRTDDGVPMRTAGRRLRDDLDAYPFPARYRSHGRHFGVPFIPIMGGRGCWGSCSYCAITSTLRDARDHGGAKMLRHRSPENVAQEMHELCHRAGGRALFCFHDDNFLMPRPKDSLARVRAIREAFDALGGGDVALIGKCRPDSVTPELMKELRRLGVLRLYVGVENASQRGADHLGRKTQQTYADAALRACRDAGIFVCYNLLLFEPDATLDDVRENIAFMRKNAQHPVNFCRAEPYVGTPLHEDVSARQTLGGSYLGFNYRIEDDRTELAFRVCSAAFRQRNFDPDGVANRNMGVGYSLKIVEHFYDDPDGRRSALAQRARRLTETISLETARFLERAIDLVDERFGDDDAIARGAVLLGLEIAAADQARHADLDMLFADLERFAADAARGRWWKIPTKRLAVMAQSVALTATLAVGTTACNACSGPEESTVEFAPPPDPVPIDPRGDILPPDPLPYDPQEVIEPSDPLPYDPQEVPPIDDDRANDNRRRDLRPMDPPPPPPDRRRMPPDPVPPPPDPPPPPPDPLPGPYYKAAGPLSPIIDQWRETTVKGVMRTTDLPLFDPPQVSLDARWEGDRVRVRLSGCPPTVSLRWESRGRIEGDGHEVHWHPEGDDDQIRVAVRDHGGFAVTSLRATQAR